MHETRTRAEHTGKHGQTTGSNPKFDKVKAQSALLQACRQAVFMSDCCISA